MKAKEFITKEAVIGPIRDYEIDYKSTYFPTSSPVIAKVHGLQLKRYSASDELFYGLIDEGNISRPLVGILQLEKLNDVIWQVRLSQVEENYKGQGFGTYLYDYAVMNDKLTIVSDSHLSSNASLSNGSVGLWKRLYHQGRYLVCGYDLSTNQVLPDAKPDDILTQNENIVWYAAPKAIQETVTEMLARVNTQNKYRVTEWYGPAISQSEWY